MKVSIITAVLNGAKTIEDCIRSVYAQTYSHIEHVIIDASSTDGTAEIINKHKDKISKFLSEKNNGVYDAMNKGIGLSSGDVIAPLNSDNFYADRSIVSQMAEFIDNFGLDACLRRLGICQPIRYQ